MGQAVGLLVVAGLVLISAYFVAMEFAFTAANRNRLVAAATSGDRKAVASLKVLDRLSFCLSGAQLGITFAALITGLVAEPVFAEVFSPILRLAGLPTERLASVSLALGFVVSTFALMVLGELAPKNLAIAIPERVARALARSTLVFLRVGGPVIRLFDGAANALLKLLGSTPVQHTRGAVTAEDLAQIIDSSNSAGHLTPQEAGLLGRALDFGALSAADVMVPRQQVVTLAEEAQGAQLRTLLRVTGHSRVPLVRGEQENFVGVVSVKDFLDLPAALRDDAEIRLLAAPVLRLPETAPLVQVMAQMRRARTQFAVVVDESGADVGILTLEDVVEELVGEVRDEYDRAEPVRAADTALLAGSLHLHEVQRETGLTLPDGDYDTLAGLVLARLGRLAEVGDEVEVLAVRTADDEPRRTTVRLRVEAVERRRVRAVRLTLLPVAQP